MPCSVAGRSIAGKQFATCGVPSTASATVTGTVNSAAGNAISGASVTITFSTGATTTATTNGSGVYSVSGTYPTGAVTVSATAPAYSYRTTAATGSGTIPGGGGTVTINTSGGPATLVGILTNGTRDKLFRPFSATSIWNQPIGAGATLSAANMHMGQLFNVSFSPGTYNWGYITRLVTEEEYIFTTGVSTQVKYSPAEWTGADRCTPSGTNGSFPFTVLMPSAYTIPNSGLNNSTAWFNVAQDTILQAQPVARCTAAGDATAFVRFSDQSVTGAGTSGAHGGSNLSAIGGTIRYGEWTEIKNGYATYFRHALKMVVPHKTWSYWGGGGGNEYRDPATVADNYASATTYGGVNSALKPGSLLTLQSSFNVAALLTTPGKALAETIKRYGVYIVDDQGDFNAISFAHEKGPNGNAVDEFTAQFTYTFEQQPNNTGEKNDWFKDVETIVNAFYIVTNNAAGNYGGGGAVAYGTPTAVAIGN